MSLRLGEMLLGKYKIERLLGSGGWGDVYLATDLPLGRQVAIKHLKTDLGGDETILQRFLQEAQVIAALQHPNIVVIHALEQDDGDHYIVEEYAERGTVGDLVAEEVWLPIEQTLNIAIAVCRALAVTHLNEIIHRDIKPSNILLFESPEGDLIPKLCDFGIAHVTNADGKSPLTTQGAMLGTVQYMSPEQIQSQPVDERSDLYSLGAVLYNMLTGRNVFIGSPWDVLQAHVNKEPRPPILERPEIPTALNDLILRALSKDPADRYQRARDMREVLERIKRQESEIQESVASLYAQGKAYLEVEDWQQAIQLLSEVVALAPGYQDIEALLERAKQQEELARLYDQGVAHILSGEWAAAIETLREIHQVDEHYRDVAERLEQVQTQQKLAVLYHEGVSAAQAENWSDAIKRFGAIRQADPDYRDAATRLAEAENQQKLAELYKQGVAYLEHKEWRQAQQCFQAIIDIDPIYRDVDDRLQEVRRQERLDVLYRQGEGYALRGDWQRAVSRFKAVLELDQAYKDAAARLKEAQEQKELETLYTQGMEHFDRGEWPQAIRRFQNILDVDSAYKDAAARLKEAQQQQELWHMYHQAQEHFEKEEWEQTIALLEQVINLDENYLDAGATLKETHRLRELDVLYARAIELQEAEEWDKAANLYLQIQGKRRGYRDTTLRLVEVDKQEKLARLYRQAGELLTAQKWPDAVARLHEIQSLDADYKDAGQLLEDAEKQERLLALYGEAEGHLARENWPGAIEALQDVLTIDPNYREAAAHLQKASYHQGVCCHEKGQLEEAIQCFERAGDYEDAPQKLADIRQVKGRLWRYGSVEWLRKLEETTVPLLRRWQAFAILGFIVAVLLFAIIMAEPNTALGQWRDRWFRGQPASPTIVAETPTLTLYPTPPALVSPEDGTSFEQGKGVKLEWEWEQELAENEFFEVRIWLPQQQEFAPLATTRLSSHPVLASKLTKSGTYRWQVAIVSRLGEERGVSQVWSFEIQ